MFLPSLNEVSSFLVLGADLCKGSRESYTSLVNNSLGFFCFTIKFSEFFTLT